MPTGTPLEGCESGRIGTLGKRVWGNSPWVRIPLPPPAVTTGPASPRRAPCPAVASPAVAPRPAPGDLAHFRPSQGLRSSQVGSDPSNVARLRAPPGTPSEPRPDQAAWVRANARADRTRSSTSSGRWKISSSKTSTTIHPAARSRRMRSASRRRSLRLEWKVSLWTSTIDLQPPVGEVDPADPALVVAEVDLPLERGPRPPAPGSPRTDARASTRSAGTPGPVGDEATEGARSHRCRPTAADPPTDEWKDSSDMSRRRSRSSQRSLDLGRVEPTGEVDQRTSRSRDREPVNLDDVTCRIRRTVLWTIPRCGQPRWGRRVVRTCSRLEVPARHTPQRQRRSASAHTASDASRTAAASRSLSGVSAEPTTVQHPRAQPREPARRHGMLHRLRRESALAELTPATPPRAVARRHRSSSLGSPP